MFGNIEGETNSGIVGTALEQKMELFELPPYKKLEFLELLEQILTSSFPLGKYLRFRETLVILAYISLIL